MKYTMRKRFVFISFVAVAVSMAFDLWAVSENGRSGSLSEYVNPMIGTGNGGQAVGIRHQGTDVIGKLLRHHGNGAAGPRYIACLNASRS